jgi:hypothetical protein
MRFLLDEDVHPDAATAARALGLDAVSVHELGRVGGGFPDHLQLRFAAAEKRVLVTRNRDDYIRLTLAFFQTGEPHAGVLVIPFSIPNEHPGRIARALHRWQVKRASGAGPDSYTIDFVTES